MERGAETRKVEICFIGPPPSRQIALAAGVSAVEVDGSTVRCLVFGSFQPFLEALRGHEVVGFTATPLGEEEGIQSGTV